MDIDELERMMNTPEPQQDTSPRQRAFGDILCHMLRIVFFFLLVVAGAAVLASPLVVACLLDAPTIDPENHAPDYAWRTKTILNTGGLGRVYWEGAECVVDLHATFEPLGTYQGKAVGRYTPRQSWWGWWQCPAGTLIELTADESPQWKAFVAAQIAKEIEQMQALQRLSDQAKHP